MPPTLLRARLIAAAMLAFTLPSVASANDFYVDPVEGSPAGDGSAGDPWGSLEDVIAAGLIETRNWSILPYADGATLEAVNAGAPVQPGDTIWLLSGHHGAIEITGAYNESPITIVALEGHTPTLHHALFRAASGWRLRGVSISPTYDPGRGNVTGVTIDSHDFSGPASEITVEACTIFSVEDSSGWSAADWVANVINGIAGDGDDLVIRDNVLTNVGFGISMSGLRSRVAYNSVRNFSGDGLRGLGDYEVFEYNYVANAVVIDDNHDDGFQSWSNGPAGVGTGEVVGVVLRGNTIVNYEDPAQPLRGTLQGIGCFDGFFVDWVIENNVIITDHWHGISLYGARDSRIVNNTVLDLNEDTPGPPWIRISPHEDGTESSGCVIRNNLATAFASEGGGIAEDNNMEITDAAALFVGPTPPYDLHLLPSAPAVDIGSAELAPMRDIEGISRPQGAAVDLGAYEWHEPGVVPADAGLPPQVDASSPPADGGTIPPPMMDGGCGCRAAGRGTSPSYLFGLSALLFLRLRSRRAAGRG